MGVSPCIGMAEAFDPLCNNGANGISELNNQILKPTLSNEHVGVVNRNSQISVSLSQATEVTEPKLESIPFGSCKGLLIPEPVHTPTDFSNTALNVFVRLLSSSNREEVLNNKLKLNKELVDLITYRVVINLDHLDSVVSDLTLTDREKKEITKCSMLEKLEHFSQDDLSADDPESEFKLFAFYWEGSGETGKIAILKATIPRHQIEQEYYFRWYRIQRTSIQLNQALILTVLDKIRGCPDKGQDT